jgi:phosphopantetheinyl transferase
MGYAPALAISHYGQLAIAIASRVASHQHLGIDLQPIASRTPEFETASFTPRERSLLESVEASARLEWLARFWCAKVAIGKALGCGLRHGPQSVIITAFEADGTVIKAVLGDKFAGEFPALADLSMAVYTIRHRDFIIATTLCEGA